MDKDKKDFDICFCFIKTPAGEARWSSVCKKYN